MPSDEYDVDPPTTQPADTLAKYLPYSSIASKVNRERRKPIRIDIRLLKKNWGSLEKKEWKTAVVGSKLVGYVKAYPPAPYSIPCQAGRNLVSGEWVRKRAGVEDIKRERERKTERKKKKKKKEKRCQYSYNCQCTDNLQWLHGVSSSSSLQASYLFLSLFPSWECHGKSWSHSV